SAAGLATAAAAAVAFFPAAAQAVPVDDRPAVSAETFVGEARGGLSEAERKAKRDAYRQARRAGYSRGECDDQRVQKTPVGGEYIVRHTIRCEDDGDDGGDRGSSLVNAEAELCLDVAGRNASIEECDGSRGQEVEISDREIRVLNNKCVGANGGRLSITRCDEGNDQRWNILRSNDRTVLLENRATGTCLAVLDRDLDEGAEVGLRKCDNSDTQEWQIRR
ncbi:MAG TPA: RICIN domain-containing protein, partial [Pilimelia sp.]|nr:RICIN domain-containing protein [Pilimelia sp.]